MRAILRPHRSARLLPPAGEGTARAIGLLATALLCITCSACAIQPWVKPYEREQLADPIMKFSRNSLPEKHSEHVRVVREGARGATGVQGGGCGCN